MAGSLTITRHAVASPRQISSLVSKTSWSRRLAGVKHGGEGSLLSRSDGEGPVGLDLDPSASVGAVEAGDGRLPGVGALVALGLVDGVGDSPQLGAGEVVGEVLALGGGPRSGTRLSFRVRAPFVHAHGEGISLTTQAFFRGTMWSMSTSLAAVQVAPS